MSDRVLVTGAGGFIGYHLVETLVQQGHAVRGVDLREPEFGESEAEEFRLLDLREPEACVEAVDGVDAVYHLAASVPGRDGPPGENGVHRGRSDALMILHLLEAAAAADVRGFLVASSAEVYSSPEGGTAGGTGDTPKPLPEEAARSAVLSSSAGLTDLYAEGLCRWYRRDRGLGTRVARLQNVYGPRGPYRGSRAATPTAVCRKVARAGQGGTVALWTRGKGPHAYLYVEDCVDGLRRLMRSEPPGPLNLAGDRMVTSEELVAMAAGAAGKKVRVEHRLPGPEGGPGRLLDTTRLREITGWAPRVELEDGVARTYRWVAEQVQDLPLDRHPGPPHIP